MKRIFTLFLLILTISFSGFSKPVDDASAKTVGQNFLAINASKTFAGKYNLALVYTASSSGSVPVNYFYVFSVNAGQGFVVVSADDCVLPVLAYSDESAFDPSKANSSVTKWLENYKEQIRYVIDNHIAATPKITNEWKYFKNAYKGTSRVAATTAVSPLVTTKWDQSPYYNDLCPYDNTANERVVTGCVATAMAQVMRFWSYPASGTGFHSYSDPNYGTLSANFAATTYDWASMPAQISSANNAVATLMYHCGVSVNMTYGIGSTGGSSAQTLDVADALKTYFGYPASVLGKHRSDYTDSDWIALLKSELDAGRPMQYAGTGSGGGHSFVCDGYDANDMFHFNWGWSGQDDGYFSVDGLNPGTLGTGGGTGGFNSNQRAIIGIEAPGGGGGGGTTYTLDITSNVTPSAASINYGAAFSITTDIQNTGAGTFTGTYSAAVLDQNNFLVTLVDSIVESTGLGTGASSNLLFNNAGSSAMVPGAYTVIIYAKPVGGNWSQVHASNVSVTDNAAISVVNSGTIEMNSAMTVTPSDFIIGQAASVTLDLMNTGSSDFFGDYALVLFTLNGDSTETIATINESTGLSAGSSYPSPFLTFASSAIASPAGTYLLALAFNDGSGWNLVGSTNFPNPVEVNVLDAKLSPDIYEVNNSIQTAYALPFSFSGNTASDSTAGSNCHVGNDYDFYSIDLPAGSTYTLSARLQDAYDSNNGNNTYTLDALFSLSADTGTTWSDANDTAMPDTMMDGGITLYFFVAPYNTGETGTYRLDISATSSVTGIQKINTGLLKVYPNPVKETVNIDLSSVTGKTEKIVLMDVHGTILRSESLNSSAGAVYSFNMQELSDGFYVLQVTTSDGVFNKKLVLSK
jgi:hypothetical protein